MAHEQEGIGRVKDVLCSLISHVSSLHCPPTKSILVRCSPSGGKYHWLVKECVLTCISPFCLASVLSGLVNWLQLVFLCWPPDVSCPHSFLSLFSWAIWTTGSVDRISLLWANSVVSLLIRCTRLVQVKGTCWKSPHNGPHHHCLHLSLYD